MWPDLAKFHHFGLKFQKVFGNFSKALSSFGNILDLLWQENTIGQSFIAVYGQILKNNLPIWSHWPPTPFPTALNSVSLSTKRRRWPTREGFLRSESSPIKAHGPPHLLVRCWYHLPHSLHKFLSIYTFSKLRCCRVAFQAVWPKKITKCLFKLPKNDYTIEIKHFDTFTKIAEECRRFGQINCCQRLLRLAQSPINHPIWSHWFQNSFRLGFEAFNVTGMGDFYKLLWLIILHKWPKDFVTFGLFWKTSLFK